MSTEPIPCTRCGTFIPTRREVYYSEQGDIVCRGCHQLQDLAASETRYVKSVRGAGYSGPAMVATGLLATALFGVFGLLLMGLGVLTSLGALISLVRDGDLRSRLGPHLLFISLFSGLAVLGGGGCLGLTVLGVGVALLR